MPQAALASMTIRQFAVMGKGMKKGTVHLSGTMPAKAFLYLLLLQANFPALVLSLSLLSMAYFLSLIFSFPLSTNL